MRKEKDDHNQKTIMATNVSTDENSENSENIEKEIRDLNAEILKYVYRDLSLFDRRFLKGYFGFIGVKGFEERNVKDRASATAFVRSALWPDQITGNVYEAENRVFDIKKELIEDADRNTDILQIFDHTEQSFRQLFTDGYFLITPHQQETIIRTMQVKRVCPSVRPLRVSLVRRKY